MRGAVLALATSTISAVTAQNFVPTPRDTETVTSQNYPGASISYKSTNSFCETTPGVKSFSGYVHLPGPLLADVPATGYNSSIFFWYFQARNNPSDAPVSIYIAGGPGESSFDDTSGFPCHINSDSNSTRLNDLSWNTNVNMLYIDQPVGTGFSYSVIANGIKDLVALNPDRIFTPLESQEDAADFQQTNVTVAPATVSAPDPVFALNTTMQAARMLWHFAQVWFQEFPEHETDNDEISIWANSYGGYYAPATFAHFARQNDRIENGSIDDENAVPLRLGTVGLTNACVDAKVQGPAYPEFAFNNTYGIEAISRETYEAAKKNITKPGGCNDLLDACRAAGQVGDPDETGRNETVNEVCGLATQYCFGVVQGAYTTYSNLNPFDIALPMPIQYPIDHASAFYNQPWVQSALGVPVNFTLSNQLVQNLFFFVTGDPVRRTYADLEFLLKRPDDGINLALVYGDRDYRCNWPGAEAVALALEHATAGETDAFKATGYADIATNSSYVGGVVKQSGRLSFSRVFQAGHNVAAYQPETVFQIFSRVMERRDVATGEVQLGDEEGYITEGPASSFGIKGKVPEEPLVEPTCLVYTPAMTCTENQVLALMDGSAKVEDWVVVQPKAQIAGLVDGEEDTGDGQDGGNNNEGGDGDKKGDEDAALGRLSMMASTVGMVCLLVAAVIPVALFS